MSHARGNHVTPEELATRSGFSPDQVRRICQAEGVPVLHGRIDQSLFLLAAEAGGHAPEPAAL